MRREEGGRRGRDEGGRRGRRGREEGGGEERTEKEGKWGAADINGCPPLPSNTHNEHTVFCKVIIVLNVSKNGAAAMPVVDRPHADSTQPSISVRPPL